MPCLVILALPMLTVKDVVRRCYVISISSQIPGRGFRTCRCECVYVKVPPYLPTYKVKKYSIPRINQMLQHHTAAR